MTVFPITLRRLFMKCYTFCSYDMMHVFHESSTRFLLHDVSFHKKKVESDRNTLLLLFHHIDQDHAPSWDKIRPDGIKVWWDEFAETCHEYARMRREMGAIHTLVRECHNILSRLYRKYNNDDTNGVEGDAIKMAMKRLDDWHTLLRLWRYPCCCIKDEVRPTYVLAKSFLDSIVRTDGVLLDLLWTDGAFFGHGRTKIRMITRAWKEKEQSMNIVSAPDWEILSEDQNSVLWMNRKYYEGIPHKMVILNK